MRKNYEVLNIHKYIALKSLVIISSLVLMGVSFSMLGIFGLLSIFSAIVLGMYFINSSIIRVFMLNNEYVIVKRSFISENEHTEYINRLRNEIVSCDSSKSKVVIQTLGDLVSDSDDGYIKGRIEYVLGGGYCA